MRVPVLDTNRRPLTPTTPARARLLLKQGKAKPYWNKLGIFCIIPTYAVEPDNQPLVVGLDPDSSFEGWSVVGTRETVANGMLEAPK
ncbi:MAG: RRXRR domain-containing protein, partial [Candidatus Methanoculleus thermohydrogenotrophicum]